MKSFPPKGRGETRNYTVAFSKVLATGATITSCTVAAEVREGSVMPDPAPTAILNGAPSLNAVARTVCGKQIGIGQAVIQSIRGGVVGCTYLLTYTATLSNGEIIVGQVALYISKYVP